MNHQEIDKLGAILLFDLKQHPLEVIQRVLKVEKDPSQLIAKQART